MTSRDYLLSRLILKHYWVWLGFTTHTRVDNSLRCRELKHALQALGVPS